MKAPRFVLRLHVVAVAVAVAHLAFASVAIAQSSSAATRIRRLYLTQQYHDGIAAGDSLVRRFPRDSRLRAWYVANVGAAGFAARAESLTARIDTASRDPWLIAARVFARRAGALNSKAASTEAMRLARRARSLAPSDPDLAWLAGSTTFSAGGFSGNGDAALAFADSVLPRVGNPVDLQIVRANALWSVANPFTPGAPSKPDTAKRAEALRAYAAARAADPASYMALYETAVRLRPTSEADALAFIKQAVAIAPRAPLGRTIYWQLIEAQRGPAAAEKREAIAADRAAFLVLTDSAPWALETALNSMRYITHDTAAIPALEDRILARAPRSTWAEAVMLARANQWRDSLFTTRDSTRPGPKSDSLDMRRRFIAASEAFINKGWSANPVAREQAITGLFFEVRDDSTYPADKLVALVRQVVASTATMAPSFRYGETARVLGSRKLELSYAQQLAREGLKHTARYLSDFPGYTFTSVGDQADALDGTNASLYDDLGLVYFAGGKYDEADKELSHALELTKKNVTIYYDLGRLRAAQRRDDEAELLYAQGMTIRYRGVNPNRKELERLYQKKNGSIDGWEKYIAALEEKERSTRRARILATRDSQPKLVPAFRLAALDGQVVQSDSVRSQYLVVNFWGTWCGPCLAEMPELQQFYDKYRNDKSVAIFTISNDKDLKELRDWMTKRKLTIPTLFDDGYVANGARINTFPTTWFIDRDGKVQFTAVGNTGALVEEWTWRLEATKAGPVVTP